MLDAIKEWSIPLPQLFAFGLTILASYFSARFGASENRRQFREKMDVEKKQAAAALIPALMTFASECENRRGNFGLHVSSEGHAGSEEDFTGLALPATSNNEAAKLGNNVAERVLKLQIIKARIDNAIRWELEFGPDSEIEFNEKILSWFALLAFKARYAADIAAKEAAFLSTHRPGELEDLLKHAQKHGSEIESGDQKNWY